MDREEAESTILDSIISLIGAHQREAENAISEFDIGYNHLAVLELRKLGAEIATRWGWTNIPELGV